MALDSMVVLMVVLMDGCLDSMVVFAGGVGGMVEVFAGGDGGMALISTSVIVNIDVTKISGSKVLVMVRKKPAEDDMVLALLLGHWFCTLYSSFVQGSGWLYVSTRY